MGCPLRSKAAFDTAAAEEEQNHLRAHAYRNEVLPPAKGGRNNV